MIARNKLIPLAILGIAGVLAFMAWQRSKKAAAGEGAAAPAQGLEKLFESVFGPGTVAAPAPAPAAAPVLEQAQDDIS